MKVEEGKQHGFCNQKKKQQHGFSEYVRVLA